MGKTEKKITTYRDVGFAEFGVELELESVLVAWCVIIQPHKKKKKKKKEKRDERGLDVALLTI